MIREMGFGERFMPHGMCYLWEPKMLLLQVVSDALIALAYFSIPALLIYLVRKRRDVPFGKTILMFGVFIVACGMTHVMSIYTIWHPAYWFEGALKAFTAIVSLVTACMLAPLVPKALTLRSSEDLELLSARLERDLATRREAHAETERQYRSLAEALPELVWTCDNDGALDYGNERWTEYSGFRCDDLVGWAWTNVVHPDDIENCLAVWTHAVASGEPYEIEYRLRRVDGEYRWHIGRAMPMRDSSGAIMRWFGTCTDIDAQKRSSEEAGRLDEQMRLNTQLKEDIAARERAEAALRASDERFRQIEEHAPIGLALVSLEGTFISVNPALCALIGYEREELVSQQCRSFMHPDDERSDRADRVPEPQSERRYLHKDGHTVWTLLNISVVRDDDGEPCYFIAQIQDITARVEAERVLSRAQEAALAATEAKSRFLAMMSHEIRTPMNGIIGMAELLSLSTLSDEQSDCVRVVRDSGRSLLRVLNDILDYSKIEAGKLSFALADFDLTVQIRSVASLLGPQFTAKDVSLSMDIDVAIPPVLKGDPGRIRQILVNLVSNALKFTPSGGNVRIMVIAEPVADGQVTMRFAVVDSGVGIDRALQNRLFQPFSQIDGSTTREYGGTGLGLSICKQLVQSMGGDIGVESAPGSGSSFWFTLPLLAGSLVQVASAGAHPSESAEPAPRRGERVLLAEDNEINTRLAVRQFKRLGFEITTVPNGREAVDLLAKKRYDIIFMDCHMPEMDGYDATRAIRHLQGENRVPIVAMTANAQPEDREACLIAGMDDYIAKPATLIDLCDVLDRWLPVRDALEV